MSTSGLRMIPCCSANARAEAHWRRFDVEKPESWAALRSDRPGLLIYCAGVCDVARCEAHPDFAWSVNVGGVDAMLDALPDSTRLVLCSSDHVFAGRPAPYVESTPPDTTSVYGRTRVAAENLVLDRRPDALIVRVGLPIGPSASGKVGHLDWLRYRHANHLPMTIVDGEHRAAVWADAAADRILALARTNAAGIRHLAATRAVPRPALAAYLCTYLGIRPSYRVVPHANVPKPHLGHVDLQSEFEDAPLPAVTTLEKQELSPSWAPPRP